MSMKNVGILDGDLNAVSYFAGRDPAFAIIGDLIAGYDTPDQVQTFCMHGGGKEFTMRDGLASLTPAVDKAVAAFIQDVEDRGLSDKILLVVTGDPPRPPFATAHLYIPS